MINLEQTNGTINVIITEFNGTTIGFDTNVTKINILDVDFSFLRQQVNQEMLKRGKGCLNARYRISTEVVLIAVNRSAIHLHTIAGGKGYSCIKTCTEKNGHVCCEEWCGSKRAAQKEGFESGCCFNNQFTVAMTTMMSFK
ncbi:ALI_collapsed_G0049050.mRNA.1.CDS.1 [Saccharomyces cerevisiae]|nr:ALI_collapsed_G0049050.mRNA.1.CDS.1 [Saccharomyces cerevisiae]